MSKEYIIKSAQRRDEWTSRYGEMVDYALALEGVEGWVKLSQKVETRPPQDGGTIFGYITQETNKNGTSYQKFKKENPEFAGRAEAQQNSPANHQMDYIIQMLEELTGRRDVADRNNDSQGSTSSGSDPFDDPFGDL